MRFAGRALIALFLLAALWAGGPPVWRAAWTFYGAIQQKSQVAADAQASTAYVVSRDRPLEFRLSGHADLVRLRVHALLPQGTEVGSAPSAAFALRIEILDTNNNLLSEQIYHVRSVVGRYLDPATGELFALNLVDDPAYAVAGVNLIPLNLTAWPSAQGVRITLAETEAAIAEVGLRLYEPEAIPEHSIEGFWQRLSERQRTRLAEGNVYPHNLLTSTERAAVLSQRWRPVGPTGVQDREYRVRSLFAREDRPGAFISYALPVVGLRLDREHPIDLPIPEAGRYLIRANLEIPPQGSDSAVARLRVEFAEAGTMPILIDVPPTTVARAVSLPQGTLRLISDKPVRVVLLRNPAAGASLPQSEETRSFLLRSGGALSYSVGDESDSVILRFDLQRRFNDSDPVTPADLTLRYEYRDAQDAVLGGGDFNLAPSPPAFDLRSDDPTALLSPAELLTMTLPPGAAKVVLTAPGDAYVAAYSRLPLADETAAPVVGDAAMNEWFGLAPTGWAALMAAGDSLTTEHSFVGFAHSGPVDAE